PEQPAPAYTAMLVPRCAEPFSRGWLFVEGDTGLVVVRVGVGGGVGSKRSVAAPTSRRPPVVVFPASEATGSTLLSSACRTSVTLALGFSENSRAAAPVTCGAAIEVPLA